MKTLKGRNEMGRGVKKRKDREALEPYITFRYLEQETDL